MQQTRHIRIEWEPGEKVSGLWAGPMEGSLGVLLAHGAGAGQRHPFMAGMRRRLAASGMSTLTFDYPYVEAGRRRPDRQERLMTCHLAAVDRMLTRVDGVALVGKSMGGRIGGHVAAERRPSSLVFLGYPLVPLGSSEPRSTDHLDPVATRMLFIQGERDRMGPPDLIRATVVGGRVEVVPDADHGFNVPKRTGLSPDDVLDRLAAVTVSFVADGG